MNAATRSRVKPQRALRLILAPTEDEPGLLRIVEGKRCDLYWITPIASTWGSAYRLEKWHEASSTYDVLVAPREGRHSCECRGFRRHGHCRHLAAVLAMIRQGWL